MSHVNPIKSRPLSAQGRENYDKIFRKPMTIDKLVATPEWMAAAEETVKAFGLDKCRPDDASWQKTLAATRERIQAIYESPGPFEDIPTALNHHI